MTHSYIISGMTCGSCVAKVKSELFKLGDITDANVQLAAPQATITMQKHVPLAALQTALQKAGNYTIAETEGIHQEMAITEKKSFLVTYKPLLLVFSYIVVVTVIAATSGGGFELATAMRIFMASFFLSFSFFKLLDLSGFADSYATYDIIGKRFRGWGYVYAFIELGLGVAYAANFQPFATNLITLVVMSISIIGVLQSVLAKRQIQCACLGAVFNLPMSTVTIVEDALMIVMSGMMLAMTW